jgi:hypothetical protein
LSALDVPEEGSIKNSAVLGELLPARLHQLKERPPMIRAMRGWGLFAGSRESPLIISRAKLEWGLGRIADAVDEFRHGPQRAA